MTFLRTVNWEVISDTAWFGVGERFDFLGLYTPKKKQEKTPKKEKQATGVPVCNQTTQPSDVTLCT